MHKPTELQIIRQSMPGDEEMMKVVRVEENLPSKSSSPARVGHLMREG